MKIAQPVLRYGMALVFLWFGIKQLLAPSDWVGWLPSFLGGKEIFVVMNGIFEVVFAVLLALGLFTRIVSLLLGVHLMGITLTIGFTAIGVRDFGLAIATLVIFLNGSDYLCFDKKLKWKHWLFN